MMRDKKWVVVAVMALSLLGTPVLAADPMSALEERLQKVESALADKTATGGWPSNVSLSGAVEIEAAFIRNDPAAPATDGSDESDLDLSKMELGLKARIVKYVTGEVVFLYEDDDLDVDEGFITLGAEEDMPFYFKAGELSFDGGRPFEPKAWNIELAYALTDRLEAALRYEGSEDGGDWIPESR